jgi:hypothetical protein
MSQAIWFLNYSLDLKNCLHFNMRAKFKFLPGLGGKVDVALLMAVTVEEE